MTISLKNREFMTRLPATLYRFLVIFIFAIAVNILCDSPLKATEGLVTGKYISSAGKDIVLHLTIQNPAPANLIVEQNFSSENKVIESSPKAKKIDNSQGNIKWLFNNTKSGILSLSIHLSAPLTGDITAIVRYRSPHGGTFTELRITP